MGTVTMYIKRVLTNSHENFIDIHGCLCGGLHEEQAVVIRVRLCKLHTERSSGVNIALSHRTTGITDQTALILLPIHIAYHL